jgi:hypothetical protein
MGLDMYLYVRKYVSSTPVFSEDDPNAYNKVRELTGVPKDFPEPDFSHANVTLNVAYWRKANQIHNWFVQNVQDGEDDCKDYYVSREQIAQLLDTCKKVKANPDLAESLLPPAEGFFFGGTEIDEYYWEDIDLTIKQLEECMKNFNDRWSYQYCSSW